MQQQAMGEIRGTKGNSEANARQDILLHLAFLYTQFISRITTCQIMEFFLIFLQLHSPLLHSYTTVHSGTLLCIGIYF